MVNTIVLPLISLGIGSAISWWVAKWYYKQATADLEQTSEQITTQLTEVADRLAAQVTELKRLNVITMRALEAAELAEFHYGDPTTDTPTGIHNRLSARAEMRTTATADLTVVPASPRDAAEEP